MRKRKNYFAPSTLDPAPTAWKEEIDWTIDHLMYSKLPVVRIQAAAGVDAK